MNVLDKGDYSELTNLYQICAKEDVKKPEISDYVKRLAKKLQENDSLLFQLIEKTKSESISDGEKITLDCLMTYLSILCDLTDANEEWARKVGEEFLLKNFLIEICDKLISSCSRFSIAEQLLENTLFIFVNVSRRTNKLSGRCFIDQMNKCLENENMNEIIHFAAALTIAFICDETYVDREKVKKILEDRRDKFKSNSEWCGFSIKELDEGMVNINSRKTRSMDLSVIEGAALLQKTERLEIGFFNINLYQLENVKRRKVMSAK